MEPGRLSRDDLGVSGSGEFDVYIAVLEFGFRFEFIQSQRASCLIMKTQLCCLERDAQLKISAIKSTRLSSKNSDMD